MFCTFSEDWFLKLEEQLSKDVAQLPDVQGVALDLLLHKIVLRGEIEFRIDTHPKLIIWFVKIRQAPIENGKFAIRMVDSEVVHL